MSATLVAAGAKDVAVVDPGEVRREFDDWLVSPIASSALDRDQARLLAFLGVR